MVSSRGIWFTFHFSILVAATDDFYGATAWFNRADNVNGGPFLTAPYTRKSTLAATGMEKVKKFKVIHIPELKTVLKNPNVTVNSPFDMMVTRVYFAVLFCF